MGLDPSAFAAFARRKEDAARSARFERFETLLDNSAAFPLESIGCPLTDALLDGPFFQSSPPAAAPPVISAVFVQSVGGNTGADDPSALGGGMTDKHLIYEGLSRVSADAVMAGANTIRDGSVVFSVWHPTLVELRHAFNKPRHPVQIVVTSSGDLAIANGLLFNEASLDVVILTTDRGAATVAGHVRARPWITMISSGDEPDLQVYAERLFGLGIVRVSAVGGPTLVTGLIDAGLVSDLYLTTSPTEGGRPGTPMYEGARPPPRDLVIRKRSSEGIVFEQFLVRVR